MSTLSLRAGPLFYPDSCGGRSEDTDALCFRLVEAAYRQLYDHDPSTVLHQICVMRLGLRIGEILGWHGLDLRDLGYGSALHDVGKVAVPSDVLNKPGKLDDKERTIMQMHVPWGMEYVERIKGLPATIAIAIQGHHERLDGSGYPHELKDKEISPAARIMAVADVVQAMLGCRVYRERACTLAEVEVELFGRGKTLYDQRIAYYAFALAREDLTFVSGVDMFHREPNNPGPVLDLTLREALTFVKDHIARTSTVGSIRPGVSASPQAEALPTALPPPALI